MINPKSKIPREIRQLADLRGRQNQKFERGFTIIEALVSIVVLSIGITSCVGLASYVLKNSEISKARLIAVNLAQEGVEVVRNIRDANWLAEPEQDWDIGLSPDTACDSPTNWEVDYSTTSLSVTYDGDNLLRDTDGVYSYAPGGTATVFQRKVTICYPQTYEMKIECTVYWTTQGTSKEILITEHLYGWK